MDTHDPARLIASLNPDRLRRELDRLDSQRAALLVLLRAARMRQRRQARAEEEAAGGR